MAVKVSVIKQITAQYDGSIPLPEMCQYPECDRTNNSRGLCSKHYQYYRRCVKPFEEDTFHTSSYVSKYDRGVLAERARIIKLLEETDELRIMESGFVENLAPIVIALIKGRK
jgi:hypothetical protein